MSDQRVTVGQYIGIDNQSKENATPDGYVRVAQNVDFDKEGRATRRKGFRRVASLVNARSLSAMNDESFGVIAVDGNVGVVRDNSIVYVAACNPFNELASAQVLDRMYCTDGDRWVVVDAYGAVHSVWTPTPAHPPIVSATTGGLPAGTYQLACTHVDTDGRESAARALVEITVGDGAGISCSLPVHADPSIKTNVYVSTPDGSTAYLVRTTRDPVVVLTQYVGTRAISTLFLDEIPPGHVVAYGHARLMSAHGRTLYFSEPMTPGLYNPSHGFIQFKDPVDMVVPVGSAGAGAGWYVASGARTYWLDGADPTKAQRVIAVPHGAVRGTAVVISSDTLGIEGIGAMTVGSAYWMASNGAFYVGAPGGSASAVPSAHFAGVSNAEIGASVAIRRDGEHRIITTVKGGSNGFGVSDTLDVVEYRNGVQV